MVADASLRESPRMAVADEGAVTVVVRHRVRPTKIGEFEVWTRSITHELTKFPGNLVQTLVISALLVCIKTYFQMPLVTKLSSRWRYHPDQ